MAENSIKVAFQGEVGAYSEEAVEQFFPGAIAIPNASFDDVFEAVVDRRVDFGVVPIENSLFGSVHANYDLLREFDVRIVAEVQVRIRHNLMARQGATIEGIEEVHSHPQALGQCKVFLREKLPHAAIVAAYDTAGAAKSIADGQSSSVAAIASAKAAVHYGLQVLATGIESNHQNYTRFLALVPLADEEAGRQLVLKQLVLKQLVLKQSVLKRNVLKRSEKDNASLSAAIEVESTASDEKSIRFKTSIVYAMHAAESGALFNSLAVFATRNIDLLKIESRPLVGKPGSYLFYLDLDGQADEESVASALQQLANTTDYIEVMGSYPRASYLHQPPE